MDMPNVFFLAHQALHKLKGGPRDVGTEDGMGEGQTMGGGSGHEGG